jgi:hypothetical protein
VGAVAAEARPSSCQRGSGTRLATPYATRFGWSIVAITAGAVALGVLAMPSHGAAPDAALAWLLFAGSSVHVAATLAPFTFAAVREHASRYPVRYRGVPAALLAAAITASLLPAPGRTAALLVFFSWQLCHYQKQNLGLACLVTVAARLPALNSTERRCIIGSGVGGVLALVAHPSVLQIVTFRPPASFASGATSMAIVVIVVCFATAAVAVVRRVKAGTTTWMAAAVYLTTVAFPMPLATMRSPYGAIGGLTLAHGLQYLLLVGQVTIGPPSRRRTQADVARLLAVLALVLAAGGVLAACSHLHQDGQLAARAIFGAYLAAVMSHFVVDAGLWRLREEFPRQWLTERAPQLLGYRTG